MPQVATYLLRGLVPMYDPAQALRIPVRLAASTVFARGTVLGEVTATPGTYKAYAVGNVDGSQTAKGVLEYDCATDASGNVTLGTAAGGGNLQETRLDAPMFFSGTFLTTELVGLDAGAVTALGRLISGTVANGVLRIG